MRRTTTVVLTLAVAFAAAVVPAAAFVPVPTEDVDGGPAVESSGSTVGERVDAPSADLDRRAGPGMTAGTLTDGDAGVDGGTGSPGAARSVAAATAPDDPENDTLGWEEVDGKGIWANETVFIDNSDGIDQQELDLLVARTMARVELVRDLEFENTTPVTIRSREAYQRNVSGAYANISEKGALHQNVKYEATFMIGEDTDAIAQLAANRGASVGGFYSPESDRIVIISDSPDDLEMDEFTLAHELVHALQDQYFEIFNSTKYPRTTEDRNNGVSGVVEGDANYVQTLYEERCNGDGMWNGTCVRPSSGPGGTGSDFHVGVYLVGFNPYSDGPGLIDQVREEGGWEAVNDMYDEPPASSEQVIHPDKYPDDTPTELSIDREAAGPWQVLNLTNGSVDHATFGEAGLFAMFWYPSYEQRSDAIIGFNYLFSNARFDAYNYDHWITDGWDGDRLLPFVTNDSSGTNETGYVWKFEWDSTRHAEQFVRGYERMLDYRNAQAVEGRVDTYRIAEEERFGDAFYLERNGTTVVVVNAPTVEDLSMIYEGAAPEPSEVTTTTTATPTPTPTPTTTADGTTTDGTTPSDTTTATPGTTTDDTGPDTTTTADATTGDGETDGQSQPGFGVGIAVLALVAAGLLAARRRGR